MNKIRINNLKKLDVRLEQLIHEFEKVLNDEQSAFENMPENLQSSERGEVMENLITNENLVTIFLIAQIVDKILSIYIKCKK